MKLGQIPIFDSLSDSNCVLLAGAGGGFDVYCALPLYFALRDQGKTVHLANLSFAHPPPGSVSDISPIHFEARADSGGSDSYFPERLLAEWFEARGEAITIHCFELTGVRPLRDAYSKLCEKLAVDAVVLVDGGTDSLMRGNESGLGTPSEDAASLAAVQALDVAEKRLVCLGFGVDDYHGVSHHDFLEAVAELTKSGGFLGSMALLPGMPEVQRYLEAVDYANARTERASIVNSSVASAIEGAFGDHHRIDRTKDSTLWINPIMAQYFSFELAAVAERLLYRREIMSTESISEISEVIRSFRNGIGIRPRACIPL